MSKHIVRLSPDCHPIKLGLTKVLFSCHQKTRELTTSTTNLVFFWENPIFISYNFLNKYPRDKVTTKSVFFWENLIFKNYRFLDKYPPDKVRFDHCVLQLSSKNSGTHNVNNTKYMIIITLRTVAQAKCCR